MNDYDLRGKRLLVLGGTSATYDLVKLAQSMGVYVIVTDDELDISKRITKQIADCVCTVSTDDIEGLKKIVKDYSVDGVFCGPSEFNLKNLFQLCAELKMTCYTTPEQWEICGNKESFKNYCKRNNVPTSPQYSIEQFCAEGRDSEVEYPVIVKPVDGGGSRGISTCSDRDAVLKAYDYALNSSKSKKVIIEKYIDNGGSIFSFRYFLDNGTYYPYLTFDTYIVDPKEKKRLISAFTYFPSHLTDTFLNDVNERIQDMFADMGLKNGTAFVQAIPYQGKIYCHEMGYRLSGGMIYKITEPLMGINDMKMMIRFALGGPMITSDELEKIKLKNHDMVMAQLMIPLDVGTIASVEGLEEILTSENIVDFLQYYYVGGTVTPKVIGTLGQHFGRFTLKAKSKSEMVSVVKYIQDKLLIKNQQGEDMYSMKFDINRLDGITK